MNLPEIIQSLESGNFNCWVTATIRDLKECEAENERLKAINSELLAACRSVVRHEAMAFQNCQAAIANAPTTGGEMK